ncbi:helix-turn-helix protein [Arcicella aurantiaca]|uniref:Helix-turn-helix protein n=1 Tax=Arcicella aurantiaca TaxID=591202 RepID=A0A316DGL8_9BACT|nr:helix-turn-helix transcriptional regulator [Arcicella aurantiaca]PWK17447.1 helix-turn-helix protein [Arcicella aurantiaca]
MKTYTLDEIKDEFMGVKGTPRRDEFEFRLQLDLLGDMIKNTRKERNLTQEALGELVGVKKSQISKLEKNASNVTIQTILKVFTALRANVNFKIQLMDTEMNIS